jgi:hypothetical protein
VTCFRSFAVVKNRLVTIRKLAEALDVEPKELMKGEG